KSKVKVDTSESRCWEEVLEGGEAFVTVMLATVLRSLSSGPKTEHELDEAVHNELERCRALVPGLGTDPLEVEMLNLRLIVDVLVALGLVKADLGGGSSSSSSCAGAGAAWAAGAVGA
ncbi:unnamed protein product, partial [Discosporangium mesarthrocarpum]